jgi:hypothetical protein
MYQSLKETEYADRVPLAGLFSSGAFTSCLSASTSTAPEQSCAPAVMYDVTIHIPVA